MKHERRIRREELDYFSTRLPRETHKQLRLYALMSGLTVQEATRQIVEGFLKRHPVDVKKIG